MSAITTHVLDLAGGTPARGLGVRLDAVEPDGKAETIGAQTTDEDGRAGELLARGVPLAAGRYRLVFDSGAYWRAHGQPAFFPEVCVDIEVLEPAAHYHVPLLMSPFGYSTYRGS
ncbi:MAG: hydroxyisourate hydrolase [Gemmatimonadaceae bacterium]